MTAALPGVGSLGILESAPSGLSNNVTQSVQGIKRHWEKDLLPYDEPNSSFPPAKKLKITGGETSNKQLSGPFRPTSSWYLRYWTSYSNGDLLTDRTNSDSFGPSESYSSSFPESFASGSNSAGSSAFTSPASHGSTNSCTHPASSFADNSSIPFEILYDAFVGSRDTHSPPAELEKGTITEV